MQYLAHRKEDFWHSCQAIYEGDPVALSVVADCLEPIPDEHYILSLNELPEGCQDGGMLFHGTAEDIYHYLAKHKIDCYWTDDAEAWC